METGIIAFLWFVAIIIGVTYVIVRTIYLKNKRYTPSQKIPQKDVINLTLPGDWHQIKLEDYLRFYKIENPSKLDVIKIIGNVKGEIINELNESQIDEVYHTLYYTVKTKPHSIKLSKKDDYQLWRLFSVDKEYEKYFVQDIFTKFYIADLKSSYCGDEKLLESYKEQLLEKNLDCLPILLAKIVKEANFVYKEDYMKKRAEYFSKYMPVTQAMTVFKYFTGVEYSDLFKDDDDIGFEIRERRIPQSVKDAVWNRAGGKCEECGIRINLEFDHIVPFSKGGANTYRNVQLLCEKCNRSKSAKIG